MISRNAYKGGHRPHMRQLSRELAEECLYAQKLVELTERCVIENLSTLGKADK